MAFKIEQGYHNWLPVQGYDAYALEIGAEFQQPTQTFLVIDRDCGEVLACPVFCG